jgi:transcriptional regulator with XRE-family HTH domain
MTIGERIKKRRLELNLTQQELADRMGYKDRSAVCQVERDKNNSITTDRVVAFAKALNCSPESLMGWRDGEMDIAVEFEKYYKDLSSTQGRLAAYLDAFARLSPQAQDEIIGFIDYRISKEKPDENH